MVVGRWELTVPAGVTPEHLLDHKSMISLTPVNPLVLDFAPR